MSNKSSGPNHCNQISFQLPTWVANYAATGEVIDSLEGRMTFVLGAVERNIREQTGGPFAAGVFEIDTGRLIALGVNLVVPTGLSMLHAEMVALSLAQQRLATHDLGQHTVALELVSSTEPCAMCLGGVHWSGVKRLVCGARDEDARAIGFDEGFKPDNWERVFNEKGILTARDVCRAEAQRVLQCYAEAGHPIYNASTP